MFFTADLHLGHFKIIEYCRRPFATLSDMNDTLIDNWNALIRDNDDVYVLGDFILARTEDQYNIIRSRLKGRIHLIEGDHDFRGGDYVES
jgi:calcineurin-like phosphoesterase family protein